MESDCEGEIAANKSDQIQSNPKPVPWHLLRPAVIKVFQKPDALAPAAPHSNQGSIPKQLIMRYMKPRLSFLERM
jgi:hypothetical protein